MIYRIFISVILTGIMISVNAQPWMNLDETKKSAGSKGDFYLVQEAFNQYWQGREIEKGKGWIQFKRWENFMEPRVYPEGKLELSYNWKEIREQANLQADMASWTSLGPSLVPPLSYAERYSGAGRINCLAFHPTNKNIMYAGAPSGGIWKSINGGQTWTALGDQLASLGVSDIAINPQNPDIIYIATGDGDSGDTYASGILKSTDGGLSWQPTQFSIDLSETIYFRRILIDPSNPLILYASSNKGVYRTADGFNSYSLLKAGHFKDLEFHPTNSQIVYATEYDPGGKSKIVRIKNSGLEVKNLFNGLDLNDRANRVELAVSPALPDALFALASSKTNSGFYALYKSVNQGDNWTKIYNDENKNLLGWSIEGDDKGGQGWYDLSLAVDPADANIIYVGGVNIWKSVDGGKTFAINAHWIGLDDIDYVHADHHMFVHSPHTAVLYSCNDGGIYKTADKGITWTDISDGLSILQVYKTSASQSSPDLFLTGNQDNGSFMRLNGEWQEVTGGDGMDNLVKTDNPDVLVTSYYYGSFWISSDGGKSFYAFGPEEERGSGAWVTPLVPSARHPEHVYAAYKNIYRSTDFGKTWARISDTLTQRINFRSLAVSPSDENYIYASTYTETFRTRNGGISWEKISDGLPEGSIMSIAVSPNNPEKIWLSLSGFKENEKVFMSEDGGDNWQNYSDGLPNIPTNFILSHGGRKGSLYLGTDVGMYYRDPSKTAWESFNQGLPNVIVNDIEIQEAENRLVIGTYGRGLWESPFYPLDPSVIYGEIFALNKYACLGDAAGFYLESAGEADSVVWNFNNEGSITSGINDEVEFSFESAGRKNIFARIYKNGSSNEVNYKNYFEVKESVELQIGSTDISNYHPQDPASLFASGANEYGWISSPAVFIEDPYSPIINISLTDTTTFYITGRIGSCMTTDSIKVNVIPGPDNDRICSAFELSLGLNGPFTNVDASTELNEPLPDTSDCNTQYTWCNESGLQNSVWFRFEAIEEVTSFTTQGFDTQIALYDAESCEAILEGNYTILAANDDYFGKDKKYAAAIDRVSLQPGKTYWIQVDGSAGGSEGEFTLLVQHGGVGIKDFSNPDKNLLTVYPNPSMGEVNLEYFSDGASGIEVFDLKGHKIFEKNIPAAGQVEEKIRISRQGMFILRVRTKDQIFNRQIVIGKAE